MIPELWRKQHARAHSIPELYEKSHVRSHLILYDAHSSLGASIPKNQVQKSCVIPNLDSLLQKLPAIRDVNSHVVAKKIFNEDQIKTCLDKMIVENKVVLDTNDLFLKTQEVKDLCSGQDRG